MSGVPQIRRGKPAPFQRPSIDLGGAAVPREWVEVEVGRVNVGDTVVDFGTVDSVSHHGGRTVLRNRLGSVLDLAATDVVHAFTAAR